MDRDRYPLVADCVPNAVGSSPIVRWSEHALQLNNPIRISYRHIKVGRHLGLLSKIVIRAIYDPENYLNSLKQRS